MMASSITTISKWWNKPVDNIPLPVTSSQIRQGKINGNIQSHRWGSHSHIHFPGFSQVFRRRVHGFPADQVLTGWWLSPTPLKNDGIRQLGWWHSQYDGKNKTCSKPPTSLPLELLPPILLSINMWHAPLGFQEILKDAVLISPLLLTNQSVYSILELVNWLDPQLYMEYPHWYTGWNMGYICYIVWNMWGLMWIRSYGSQVGPHPSTQSGWWYTYKVVPPLVINWCINPINYRYITYKP